MSKFAIGEKVDNAADDREVGTVIAVFPTIDGRFRYAVDTEGYGTLQFFAEEKLVVHPAREWRMVGRAIRPCDAGKYTRRYRGVCALAFAVILPKTKRLNSPAPASTAKPRSRRPTPPPASRRTYANGHKSRSHRHLGGLGKKKFPHGFPSPKCQDRGAC
jgi:hypothetical protein